MPCSTSLVKSTRLSRFLMSSSLYHRSLREMSRLSGSTVHATATPMRPANLPDATLEQDEGDRGVPVPEGAWLFHRDARGKTCFTEAEARAVRERVTCQAAT